MFVQSDTVSEVIAHFIGCLEIRVDEMRMRHAYEEFYREQHQNAAGPIQWLSPGFAQHLELDAYGPGVSYRSVQQIIDVLAGSMSVSSDVAVVEAAAFALIPGYAWSIPVFGLPAGEHIQLGREPGSVMLSANQVLLTDDNDFIVLGDVEVGAIGFLADAAPLAALLGEGLAVSEAFSSIDAPADMAAIPDYFASVQAAIDAIAGSLGSDGETSVAAVTHRDTETMTAATSVLVGPGIEGVYVDGALVEAAPSLLEALPGPLQEAVAEPDPEAASAQIFSVDLTDVSMTIEAGANLMVNEAVIVNAGLAATFLAIAGDYHSINAIIQTNVHSDNDVVDACLPGAASAGGTTQAHNLAAFASELRDSAAEMAAAHAGVYPAFWQVSVVEGDLVFLDWITQYSFTTDSDTHVLSAMGTTTTITSGENLGLNSVSFDNLGHYYDLIIVAGSLYDGNVIIQTNVLYDNDMLAMLSGGGLAGEVSTSGNLLWNSASILNVGAGAVSSGLPDPYSDAIAALGAADYAMPASLRNDGIFEGFDGLRVLYIAGNLYDLHSVQQVNVMGDADLVAIYQADLLDDASAPEWSVSTGSNALINVASIIDYDSVGRDVHVGGEIYSDAILIQADLMIASDAAPLSSDALVSEVIAFLDIDLGDAFAADGDHASHSVSDGSSMDAMQSVLG